MRTAEEILKEKNRDMISISPEKTIYEAIQIMNKNRIGAIVVKEKQQIVGIWTERDLMIDMLKKGFDLKTAKIRDYMCKDLVAAGYRDPIPMLQDKFLGKRLRHLFIKKDGKIIGLLSSGDVTRASLAVTAEELSKLNAVCSWEYYENWRWKRPKK